MSVEFHATTICAVKRDKSVAIAGDGQVTMGQSVVMKIRPKRCAVCIMARLSPVLPDP